MSQTSWAAGTAFEAGWEVRVLLTITTGHSMGSFMSQEGSPGSSEAQ